MISNIKILIKFIIYYIINLFICPSQKVAQKSILLIRLDAIGDYVMFRNFVEILKSYGSLKDYKITLLGNIAWKSLALDLDSKFVDKFIWIDIKKFHENFIYRYYELREITSLGYELVLSTTYSRDFFVGDNIVKLVNAKEKIGSIGDLSNIKKWQKKISDKYYTKLIEADSELLFEFNRNKEFFEIFLGEKLDIVKPTILLKPRKLQLELPKKYLIIFVGASAAFRKWNIENFAKIGNYLKDNYGYEVVLCGATSDKKDALEFTNYFENDYIDLVGETSLVDLLYIIANGDLLIANETLAPHLAVALDTINILVISNGNHYGRFTPYPKDISKKYHVIYHPQIEEDLGNYKKLSNSYGFGSTLDINEISVESVIYKVDDILNE